MREYHVQYACMRVGMCECVHVGIGNQCHTLRAASSMEDANGTSPLGSKASSCRPKMG